MRKFDTQKLTKWPAFWTVTVRFIYAKALPQGTFYLVQAIVQVYNVSYIIMGNPLTIAPLIALIAGKTPISKEIAQTTPDAKCAKAEGHQPGDPECKHFTEPLANVVV